jgi:4-hydroxy-tetrahydrodipicolinate reductase
MMKYMSQQYDGVFDGYTMKVVESHQSAKSDTSGTAKDVVKSFKGMGIEYEEEMIEKIRDPEQQVKFGVSKEHIPEFTQTRDSGHAYHTYTLTSEDGSVEFEFKHNVNGRKVYAEGSVDAAEFLS